MKIKLNVMATTSAIIMFFLGFGLIFITSFIHGMVGQEVNPASLHFGKAVGGATVSFAVMAWFSCNSCLSRARNALVLDFNVFFFLTSIEYIGTIFVGDNRGHI